MFYSKDNYAQFFLYYWQKLKVSKVLGVIFENHFGNKPKLLSKTYGRQNEFIHKGKQLHLCEPNPVSFA